jgi:signal transduction histidine kinase
VTRILLLLDQKENQQLLAGELARRHQVHVGREDSDLDREADLLVVDGRALDRLWERIYRKKQDERPIHLPVLLVTSRPDVKMITRHVWRSVDELLITPVEKPELRARIEVLLRARSLSLALRQRAEDAEQAARTRDEVLAIVSHDLRNPLDLVMANAGFLLETHPDLDVRAREQLQMINRAAGQMNRLIQDLLEVAGMEAGSIPVAPQPEAVEPLVREACSTLEHVASARSIEIVCEFGPGLPCVHADRDRVLQVFANLVGNALKFTPEGGRIEVRSEREESAVRFSVSDSGPGIEATDLPHVFDRFWQAQRSRAGGAGLGLAISRGIVEAHGGEMWVESELDRGSTFLFTLPAAHRGGDGAAAPAQFNPEAR